MAILRQSCIKGGKMAFEAGLRSSMSRNRFKKSALCATAGIALLLALLALLIAVEQRRTQAETGAVLSAFFSQEVLHDMDKWGAGGTITIVVMRNPDCRICAEPPIGVESQSWFAQSLKSRGSSVLEAWFAQSSKITRASFFLNSVFSRNLSTDLRLPSGARAVFIDPSDLGTKVGDFEARFPNSIGRFVVSHVGLNLNKTEALFYIDHFCPGLCGGGAYVLMHKVSGVWHVVDRRATWIS
jgi:hypothetical protein